MITIDDGDLIPTHVLRIVHRDGSVRTEGPLPRPLCVARKTGLDKARPDWYRSSTIRRAPETDGPRS